MNTSNWFDDQPVIGKLLPEQAAAKLREVGENEAADMLEVAQDSQSKSFFESRGRKSWWPFQDKPWQHTAHAFGYLAPSAPGSDPQPIYSISNISADASLKNARINIALNRLRVAAYPGGGMHRVLLHCYAQNQVPGKTDDANHPFALKLFAELEYMTYERRSGERVEDLGPRWILHTLALTGSHNNNG